MSDWLVIILALFLAGSFFLGILIGKMIKWGQE